MIGAYRSVWCYMGPLQEPGYNWIPIYGLRRRMGPLQALVRGTEGTDWVNVNPQDIVLLPDPDSPCVPNQEYQDILEGKNYVGRGQENSRVGGSA